MDQPADMDPLAARLRVMQILIGSLLTGVLGFMVLAVFLRASGDRPVPERPLVSYICLGLSALNVLSSLVIPNIMVAAARKRIAASVRSQDIIQHGRGVTADDAAR